MKQRMEEAQKYCMKFGNNYMKVQLLLVIEDWSEEKIGALRLTHFVETAQDINSKAYKADSRNDYRYFKIKIQ